MTDVHAYRSLARSSTDAVSGGGRNARTGHWAGADRAGEAGVLRTAVPSTGPLSRLCSLGIGDRIECLGHRNDVSEFLRQAKVFVLTSRSDNARGSLWRTVGYTALTRLHAFRRYLSIGRQSSAEILYPSAEEVSDDSIAAVLNRA